jgi:hypothetical protein
MAELFFKYAAQLARNKDSIEKEGGEWLVIINC